jgi:hypothetical protein
VSNLMYGFRNSFCHCRAHCINAFIHQSGMVESFLSLDVAAVV